MATDYTRGNLVLYGGNDGTSSTMPVTDEHGSPLVPDDETWLYVGSSHTWSIQTLSTKPCARSSPGTAWDGAHSVVVLFGGEGCGSGVQNDTWQWNGTAWQQCNNCGTPPSARLGHRMAWDPSILPDGKVVMFGGSDGQSGNNHLNNTTWTINGTWTQCSGCTAANSPSKRCCGGMAYNPNTSAVILFGGQAYQGSNRIVLGGDVLRSL